MESAVINPCFFFTILTSFSWILASEHIVCWLSSCRRHFAEVLDLSVMKVVERKVLACVLVSCCMVGQMVLSEARHLEV